MSCGATKERRMSTKYQVTAGNNSTDLGKVGEASTIIGAKRIGRKAVLTMLPNGEGTYYYSINGQRRGETRSIRTGFAWVGLQ